MHILGYYGYNDSGIGVTNKNDMDEPSFLASYSTIYLWSSHSFHNLPVTLNVFLMMVWEKSSIDMHHFLNWWATRIHSLRHVHVQSPVEGRECYRDHCASGWCEPNLKWWGKKWFNAQTIHVWYIYFPTSPHLLAKCRHIYHTWMGIQDLWSQCLIGLKSYIELDLPFHRMLPTPRLQMSRV